MSEKDCLTLKSIAWFELRVLIAVCLSSNVVNIEMNSSDLQHFGGRLTEFL